MTAVLAALGTACGGDDPLFNGFDDVTDTVEIRLESGAGLRSLTLTLTYERSALEVLSVDPGDAPLATATCSHAIAPGRTTATCASATTFAAPRVVWRLTTRHPEVVDATVAISGVACEGTDAAGAPVAVTCSAADAP